MSDPVLTLPDRRLLLLALGCCAAACLCGTAGALAHAALVRSDPPRRALLSEAPRRIRLWFSERLEPEYSSIAVLDSTGQPVATGRAAVSADDAKLLILALPPLAPGDYTVRYRVNSLDGHILEQSYPFTLKSAPSR